MAGIHVEILGGERVAGIIQETIAWWITHSEFAFIDCADRNTKDPIIVPLMMRLPERIAFRRVQTRLCHQRLEFSGREISPEKGVVFCELSRRYEFELMTRNRHFRLRGRADGHCPQD